MRFSINKCTPTSPKPKNTHHRVNTRLFARVLCPYVWTCFFDAFPTNTVATHWTNPTKCPTQVTEHKIKHILTTVERTQPHMRKPFQPGIRNNYYTLKTIQRPRPHNRLNSNATQRRKAIYLNVCTIYNMIQIITRTAKKYINITKHNNCQYPQTRTNSTTTEAWNVTTYFHNIRPNKTDYTRNIIRYDYELHAGTMRYSITQHHPYTTTTQTDKCTHCSIYRLAWLTCKLY